MSERAAGHVTDDGHPRRWLILVVLCLSLVMVVAANSGLNVALPTLVRRIEATQTQLQWIIDAYAVVFAALLLPAGALGDRFGRRRTLLVGLVVFAAANLWAATSDGAVWIIAARAVMGAGAALVMPATLSILTSVFPSDERGQAIAIWAGLAGAGAAIGPVASGVLLESFWWGSIFLVNLPTAALGVAGAAALIPPGRPRAVPLDLGGAALAIVGLACLVFGIIEGPARGWTDPFTLVGLVVGAAALAGFAAWERRTGEPMLDPRWLRERQLAAGVGTVLVAFLVFIALMFLITQYFQFVLGYSALVAAIAALPVAAMMLVIAPRSAGLAGRFGTRRVIAAGLAALGAGLGLLSAVATPDGGYWPVGMGLTLAGVGLALSTPPATGLILAGLPDERAGVGSALNDAARELGAALGVALLGSMLTTVYRGDIVVTSLTARSAATARRSIGAALEMAGQLPDKAGQQLATSARQAFTSGFTAALAAGALLAVAAAALVWWWAPGDQPASGDRSADHHAADAGPVDPAESAP